MRRAIVMLCLAFCLIAFWLMPSALQPKEPVATPKVPTAKKASISTPIPPKAEKPPAARKPLQITSKGKIRLKPGESTVLGYWEIAPGMNGMAIVTPEGHVKMTTKLLHLPDAAVSDAEAHDLFFNLNDLDNYSAIDPDRLRGLQQSLQSTQGLDMLTTPTVVTLPGQQASISIGNSNESTLSLNLQADPIADAAGYDLSLEFQRQE